ncbi:unnamed protein product [Ectocarpus fasciculatus]
MNSHVSEHVILVLHFWGQSVSAWLGGALEYGLDRMSIGRRHVSIRRKHATYIAQPWTSVHPCLLSSKRADLRKKACAAMACSSARTDLVKLAHAAFVTASQSSIFSFVLSWLLRYNLRTSRDHTGVFLRLSSL